MNRYFEIYPEGNSLYFVEFSQWEGQPATWQLFQRQWIGGYEVHPFNLGGNNIAPEHLINMNTKTFLKFMVDALNKAVKDI